MDRLDNKDNSRYILSSVDSALSILNLFLKYDELSATEIGNEMGISRSTAFRFIVTLENRDFLYRAENGKYRLGLNIFSLGMLAHSRMEIVNIVHPYLLKMAQLTGETSHLAILENDREVIFIDRALGTRSLKMDTPMGYEMKLHNTATGKAILAYQDDKKITDYLRYADFTKTTDKSIESAQQLLRILDDIKRDGYACDSEEAEPGLTCFAKPLLNRNTKTAYAAISVSGPTTRMLDQKEKILNELQFAVDEISSAMR